MSNLNASKLVMQLQAAIAKQYLNSDNPQDAASVFPLNQFSGLNPNTFEPTREYWFQRDIQSHSAFLSMINIAGVNHPKGGSVLVPNAGRVSKTFDTAAGQARQPNTANKSSYNEYETKTVFRDFAMHRNQILALGSENENWLELYRDAFFEAQGNDRIMIGWHGVQHTPTSNRETNPMLEDINKGWIQLMKERASSQVLTGGAEPGVIKIGKKADGGDFANLDHLFQDLYSGIPLHLRRPAGMTALASEAILAQQEGIYFQQNGNQATEKSALLGQKALMGIYGGLETMPTPFMPQTCVFITGLKRGGSTSSNLSLYYLNNSSERFVRYDPEITSLVDWNAVDEAYHVEDPFAAVVLDVEEIVFLDTGEAITRIPEHKWAPRAAYPADAPAPAPAG